MSHFSAAEWVEFVRDTVPAEDSAPMQRHLDQGCAECQHEAAIWSEVLEIGRRERSYDPPSEAVRIVKAAFHPEGSWKWLAQVAELATLVFDSIRQPAPAEIRGATTASRQFLQQAKPFMIDFRVECEPARQTVRLIGQVLNSAEPDKDVSDVEIFLLKGEHLTTRTNANASGEFDLDFKDEDDLQLFIDIRGQKVIEVRLPAPLADCQGIIKEAE